MISVIFPAYNEEENVRELYIRISDALRSHEETFEIIAVENGSTDHTLEMLKNLSPIKIIVFSRNYGQTAALDAGIQAAKGEIIAILDADLQNDPADIPKMLKKLKEGYDAVVGWRKNRMDTLSRKVLSKLANWLTSKVVGLKLHDHACGLKVFKKEFARGLNLYGEMHVLLAGILHNRGARVVEMIVQHNERAAGASKHNFMKAIKDIGDLLTVKFLSDYMSRPMLFFGGWGIASTAAGISATIYAIVLKLRGVNFAQTPLPVVAVLFFILGFLLFMLGFIAELMLRVYYESKKERPYMIRETIEK
ncbi:MAG: hypothetical protein A3C80_00595 [Candidatus Ryanbacteria bacterium RIFCSPHIGHO2_02_FULL_45_43]|uniref:Glycosyltransferase 2-like domain-containing protein n=1 Tax=Candidatus Ryanbacteria bacterium RIFCSPHIGHO2_01_45_13 TaxID=1802112 RepID=A0A1G2FYW2_9BACT|nr:MAG: hypothetical protein A2718_01985 [Candidatus Ryanbacteria bacterium RIFCSPHIGHO2_01_FULL_44_130]OGZ42761.1 MAG: hypothetical protein A2W41_03080 [Candidatus Ryanbacteria bacterium RIFCSPHIGHO2_01_45_13]OGZ48852.1 MAG: hypothetical protein A3C80_00595 [Candidatus Ryanbacteria bacterium RIFCSPHIGHO2_02_FULL_45_43]OGZ50884.1 MAG: hypothetical protein A3E55_02615 [Candidatus Ryanbacteria bacterium RIFCSPHIGHO2_12_FULL_44_20]OGZ52115.1 MAG: hypothetical protein A3A17_01200 [Candidatus Ryanba